MTLGEEVILLLVGGGIAILGSLATSVANALREGRIRDEGRIAELNREVSTGLAMARAVLDDASPDRVALSANVALHQQLDDLKENWQPWQTRGSRRGDRRVVFTGVRRCPQNSQLTIGSPS